jgi:hypothetical protein
VRRAGEIYMGVVNRLSELAVNARSEAREGYRAYRSSYDIAMRYRRDVLPLRKTIADEAMLRYGAVQIDVFALLTEARQRIAASRRSPGIASRLSRERQARPSRPRPSPVRLPTWHLNKPGG